MPFPRAGELGQDEFSAYPRPPRRANRRKPKSRACVKGHVHYGNAFYGPEGAVIDRGPSVFVPMWTWALVR